MLQTLQILFSAYFEYEYYRTITNRKIKLLCIIHKSNKNHVQPTSSSSEEGNKGSSLMSISDTTDISARKKLLIM